MKLTKLSWLALALCLSVVAPGCTTYRHDPPRPTASVDILAFLQPGRTTRAELHREFGPPAKQLQADRLCFYRLEGIGHDLGFSEEMGTWKRSKHSLVLIFDNAGVLEKSSLVRVR